MRKSKLPILYSISLIIFCVLLSGTSSAEMKKTNEGLYYCTRSDGKVDPALVAKLKYDVVDIEKIDTESVGEAIVIAFKVKEVNTGYLPKDVKDLYMTAALYPNMRVDKDTTPFFVIIGITEIYQDDTAGYFGFDVVNFDRDTAYYKRLDDAEDMKKL